MAKKYNEIEAKDNMVMGEKDNTEETVVSPKEKKNLESVLTEQPAKVKRNLFGRLVTGIVGPEGLPGIGSYVNDEIIKPAIKNIIVDAVTSGINMVMYGEKGGGSRGGYRPGAGGGGRTGGGYRPNTNYSSNYRNAPVEPTQDRVVTRTARHGVEDYIILERFDAANVLTALTENADNMILYLLPIIMTLLEYHRNTPITITVGQSIQSQELVYYPFVVDLLSSSHQ